MVIRVRGGLMQKLNGEERREDGQYYFWNVQCRDGVMDTMLRGEARTYSSLLFD